MPEPDQPLADVIEEVVAALAAEVSGDERETLLRRLDVLRRLDLSSHEFSAETFLRTEVERALGV